VPASTAVPSRLSDRAFYALNAVLSASALAFLGWLLVVRRAEGVGADLSFMPAVNACLNAASATCLTLGWVAIKRRRPDVHRALMVTALAASTLFLIGYVAYHYAHGDTKYAGAGALRVIYLAILASHVLLSMAVVPLALTTFYFAFKGEHARHRRVARVTLPVWLYVSVTGVVVYFMLHG
jgi:putative membrane protein